MRDHLGQPTTVRLDEPDPYQRGVRRGEVGRAAVTGCWAVYEELFAAQGVRPADVRDGARGCLDAVAAWAPHLAAEVSGTAAGAGLEEWQVAALNARTEILALTSGARPGECSTVVSTRAPAFSAQTWDWHEELAGSWHLQSVATAERSYVGLTEHGILAKIGLNDAGVGVHLNVLGHRDDAPGAVPVHLVAAEVLHSATSLDHALDILVQAPVRTSSAITVVTPEGARIVELSPAGNALLPADERCLLHTNHFLAAGPAAGERTELYQPDSLQRLDLLTARVQERFDPADPADLLPYLCTGPGDPAEICCAPSASATLGERWATLATVLLRPADGTVLVAAGSPVQAGPESWVELRTGPTDPPAG
ncbi:C45 family autoproteolytic acyltransferase/hydolase [Nocardioides sp. SYSU DS0663]|uniref:C45 family autoproteolytic acyltransferase/hydolase n=1 Tax=Nocardioides sp. SYSU DS0663 TaxID=3416445 RepID=UPI003F4B6F35